VELTLLDTPVACCRYLHVGISSGRIVNWTKIHGRRQNILSCNEPLGLLRGQGWKTVPRACAQRLGQPVFPDRPLRTSLVRKMHRKDGEKETINKYIVQHC